MESIADNTEISVPMILVGNKTDMQREVSTEEGKRMADNFGIKYFETSAKENINITECMQDIIKQTYYKKQSTEVDKKIEIGNPNTSSTGGCSC